MPNYYFVAPALPALELSKEPEMPFEEVMVLLESNLVKEDYDLIKALRMRIDLDNIRALYREVPLDPHGNLREKELDEALLVEAGLPEYVFEFLGRFEDPKDAVGHFYGLLSRYYNEEIGRQTGFLKRLLTLHREMRLVLLALRAKKAKRDVATELQYEDFTDPIVAQILAQKDADDYDPPQEYQDLKKAVEECGNNPWRQHLAVTEYELDRIEEMAGYPLFSIDWIVGYVARLILVERINRLDDERGGKIVDQYKAG